MNVNITISAVVAIVSTLTVPTYADTLAANGQLFAFTSPAELANMNLHDTTAAETILKGSAALRIDFADGDEPTVTFAPLSPWDMSQSAGVEFDVVNLGPQSAKVGFKIFDEAEGTPGRHTCAAYGLVPGAAATNFVIDFADLHAQPIGVQGTVWEPGGTLPVTYSGGKDPFDFKHVASMSFGSSSASSGSTVYIENVRLVPQDATVPPPVAMTGIVDEYGQFAWADWPGKLHSASDFAVRKATETRDLASHPAMSGRDRFGGWADGPMLPHTSYFTTAKYKGQWALVDPDGHLFLSIGIDCVTGHEQSPTTGREALFSWLPANSELHDAGFTVKTATPTEGTVDFLAVNLARKFGDDWLPTWKAEAQTRLSSWGFNTIGNWSSESFYGDSHTPYTVAISLKGPHPSIGNILADPWDPQFASDVAAAIAPKAAKVSNDPWCIGYFVDNELYWHDTWGLWDAALRADSTKSAAKQALIDELKAKYGTINALNSAWGSQIASWDSLSASYVSTLKSDAVAPDMRAFATAQAEKYFTVIRDALKAADPNHLYLGCRFAQSSPEAVAACAKVCDVVSFNVYERRINPGEWKWTEDYDKPMLIGEFHFGALDRGLFRVGLQGAANQEGRAKAFSAYVNDVVHNPSFIGCH